MLYDAIALAHEQNNEEFFEYAYDFYGPLIDAALKEMDLPPL